MDQRLTFVKQVEFFEVVWQGQSAVSAEVENVPEVLSFSVDEKLILRFVENHSFNPVEHLPEVRVGKPECSITTVLVPFY